MKLEKIDLAYYDRLSGMEERLKKILENNFACYSFSTSEIYFPKYENQIIYFLTILTILYKEQQIDEYIEETTIDTAYHIDTSEEIEEIQFVINKLLYAVQEKNIELSTKIIMEHGILIDELIKQFYMRKEQNYILEKEAMYLIVENKKIKELLSMNPFAINQYLQYKSSPMTQSEKIICDILEYSRISKFNNITNQEVALKCIKQLLIKNYEKQELEKAIIFIIGNVYQETEETANVLYNELRHIIENPKITNKQIQDYFMSNDVFSNKVLNAFIIYASKIKFERLQSLAEKPSYQYIKNRQKK